MSEPVAAVDYRLVAIGSLLPDLVDRVQRAGSAARTSPDRHLLGHTLLLNLPLLWAGVQLAGRGDPRLLALGAASLTHLLVDPVVRSPRNLFWPLLGFEFPAARGLSMPLTVLTQVAAATAVAITVVRLQRRGRLWEFISSGRL